MSHILSITVKASDGKYYNLPSRIGDIDLSDDEAVEFAEKNNLLRLFNPFDTVKEAVKQAKIESSYFEEEEDGKIFDKRTNKEVTGNVFEKFLDLKNRSKMNKTIRKVLRDDS